MSKQVEYKKEDLLITLLGVKNGLFRYLFGEIFVCPALLCIHFDCDTVEPLNLSMINNILYIKD